MSKEGRVIALAILTIFIYAFSILLQKGAFIFPFPLNEIIFFISALAISFHQFKKEKILSVLFPVVGCLCVLSSEFYWAIFFNAQQMEAFSNSLATDLFKIFFFIGLISLICFSFKEMKNKLVSIGLVFSILGIIISLIIGHQFIEIASLLIVSVISIKRLAEKPILNLWILLFVLEITKLWSLAG